MEITFIAFPAKERDSSIACKFTSYFRSLAHSLKSLWVCSNYRRTFLTIRVAIDVKRCFKSEKWSPKWLLWGSHSVWLHLSVEFYQLKRHILCTTSCKPPRDVGFLHSLYTINSRLRNRLLKYVFSWFSLSYDCALLWNIQYLGKLVKDYNIHELDKEYETLGFLLNGWLCANCVRHILLLSLAETTAIPCLMLQRQSENALWFMENIWMSPISYLITYLLTYLLTYSMEQSPSWDANWFSARQEIPCILWSPKVHYRIHKCPPPVPVLSQINPVRAPHPTSWGSILILSSHLRAGLPSGLFPSGFPIKTLYTLLLSPYMLHSRPNSFFLIWSPEQNWVISIDH